MKKSTLSILMLCSASLCALPAHAAGFDCGKAAGWVEKTICANAELSKLDEELAQHYKAQLADAGNNPGDIRDDQRLWLKFQRNTCGNEACLIREYRERLSDDFVYQGTEDGPYESGRQHYRFPQNAAYGTFAESAPIAPHADAKKNKINKTNKLEIITIPGEPELAIIDGLLTFNHGHTCEIDKEEAIWSQNHWVLNDAAEDLQVELRLYPATRNGKTQLLIRDLHGRYRHSHCGMQGYFDGLVLEKIAD